MEALPHPSRFSSDWKELYKAALFEDDDSKVLQRIAEAERALSARAVELLGAGGTQVREQQAMENAIYFLRLLRRTEARLNASCEETAQVTQRAG